jgi:hypothetical protein
MRNTCRILIGNPQGLGLLGIQLESRQGSGGIAPTFLTLGLDGVEWSASHPDRFNAREMVLGTHCIGRWVGPRAGLDAVEKRKFLPLTVTERRLILKLIFEKQRIYKYVKEIELFYGKFLLLDFVKMKMNIQAV